LEFDCRFKNVHAEAGLSIETAFPRFLNLELANTQKASAEVRVAEKKSLTHEE
jgi:hypothetical protein